MFLGTYDVSAKGLGAVILKVLNNVEDFKDKLYIKGNTEVVYGWNNSIY